MNFNKFIILFATITVANVRQGQGTPYTDDIIQELGIPGPKFTKNYFATTKKPVAVNLNSNAITKNRNNLCCVNATKDIIDKLAIEIRNLGNEIEWLILTKFSPVQYATEEALSSQTKEIMNALNVYNKANCESVTRPSIKNSPSEENYTEETETEKYDENFTEAFYGEYVVNQTDSESNLMLANPLYNNNQEDI